LISTPETSIDTSGFLTSANSVVLVSGLATGLITSYS